MLGEAALMVGQHRDQTREIELARLPEQHTAAVPRLAGRAGQRPCGVLGGEVEVGFVRRFVLQPTHDMAGEGELVERLAEGAGQGSLGGIGIEAFQRLGLDLVPGTALHEQALARVERSEPMVARGQRAHLRADAEQLADEVFEVGRERDDEVRLLAGGKRLRRSARRRETRRQRALGSTEMLDE